MTRFRDRLLLWVVVLLAIVLGLNLLLVRHANLENARRKIDEDLRAGAEVFERVFQMRLDQLQLGARLMADDWAFRRLYGGTTDFAEPGQRRTLLSALENYRTRMQDAAFLQLVSLDDELQADTRFPAGEGLPPYHFPALIRAAEELDDFSAMRFERMENGELVLLIAVPVLLPDPSGWIVAGFLVDDPLATEFRRLTGLEVSFLATEGNDVRMMASSLPLALRDGMVRNLPQAEGPAPEGLFDVLSEGETWIGSRTRLAGDGRTWRLLQQPLSRELAPYRRLEERLSTLTVAALLLSGLLATWLARGISRPVQELAGGVERIAHGNYDKPVRVGSCDELGRLAAAFNQMTQGLVERDRVRDLLGKNVSPEIAAELLRRPMALGGEEKEVTILFTDLRGFTALSESVTPSVLLDILNDYFTQITRVIEAHGGIVDKYIGDAVMAVFGAPLEMPDHARRAAACARALTAALEEYNLGRNATGQLPMATGIGIATGEVVVGNMGSESRHNYTVIGDAVNLASRLQDQTKAFKVSCVIAASTVAACGGEDEFEFLGVIPVRGKVEPVEVYTLSEKSKPTQPA